MVDVSLVVSSLPKILSGIGLTFQFLLLSAAIGLVIAITLMLMRISGNAWLSWPAGLRHLDRACLAGAPLPWGHRPSGYRHPLGWRQRTLCPVQRPGRDGTRLLSA